MPVITHYIFRSSPVCLLFKEIDDNLVQLARYRIPEIIKVYSLLS